MAIHKEGTQHGDTHASTVDLFPGAVNEAVTDLTPLDTNPVTGWRGTGASTRRERSPTINTHHAARALVATLAALLLGACSDDAMPSTEVQSSPSAESSSAEPSAEPSSAGPSTPDDTSDYNPLGPTSQTNLQAGRWAVTAAGSRGAPLAVFELPAGLNGGSEYIWTVSGATENDGWTLGYWTGGEVYLDPCTRKGTFDTRKFKFPDIWVEALAAQRRTETSPAVPVTLGGYDGIYLELSSPTGLDFSTCRDDRLTIFETTAKGGHHWIADPGVVERYWVLDVDDQRVVLTGAMSPAAPDSEIEQLTEIVESVQFKRS